mmetsp:Transcript_5878/g.13940  ORF Transcript_5878/g.13940 Transcript_5878/m.13940 type:complete len:213 (+) Transcript_5878:352-990(+)
MFVLLHSERINCAAPVTEDCHSNHPRITLADYPREQAADKRTKDYRSESNTNLYERNIGTYSTGGDFVASSTARRIAVLHIVVRAQNAIQVSAMLQQQTIQSSANASENRILSQKTWSHLHMRRNHSLLKASVATATFWGAVILSFPTTHYRLQVSQEIELTSRLIYRAQRPKVFNARQSSCVRDCMPLRYRQRDRIDHEVDRAGGQALFSW